MCEPCLKLKMEQVKENLNAVMEIFKEVMRDLVDISKAIEKANEEVKTGG